MCKFLMVQSIESCSGYFVTRSKQSDLLIYHVEHIDASCVHREKH